MLQHTSMKLQESMQGEGCLVLAYAGSSVLTCSCSLSSNQQLHENAQGNSVAEEELESI